MKNIYFAAALAVLAFSACSNDKDDENPSSSSTDGSTPSSSSTDGSTPSSSSKDGSTPSSSSKGGSGSKSGACYFTFTMLQNMSDMCAEGKIKSITASDCNEMLADMDEEEPEEAGLYTVKFQNSCPSGEKLKCEDDETITYFYGNAWIGVTCDMLMEDD